MVDGERERSNSGLEPQRKSNPPESIIRRILAHVGPSCEGSQEASADGSPNNALSPELLSSQDASSVVGEETSDVPMTNASKRSAIGRLQAVLQGDLKSINGPLLQQTRCSLKEEPPQGRPPVVTRTDEERARPPAPKRRAWSFTHDGRWYDGHKVCGDEDYPHGRATAASFGAHPPLLMQKSALMVRVYYLNHAWKSVVAKSLVVFYLAVIFYIMFRASNPWYEFFYYLTLQGWTLELVYFSFSLYLDILVRIYGSPDAISRVSKAAAQAMSELVFAVQVVIVMFFWIVVYPQETWRSVLWELNCHGMGLLLMVADYLYRFTGFSLRNHKYIVVFALLYSALYAFVVLYLKRQVYPGMDFRSVRSALVFLAGLSTVVFTHKIFYLISNWRWIKEDVKSVLGISKVILLRQSSLDILTHGVPEFGTELFSIPARAAPLSRSVASRRSRSAQLR